MLSKFNITERDYGPDTDLGCVHFDHDIRDITFGQGYDKPLYKCIMEKCVKKYPDPTWQCAGMART